jgi:hypothetical protein
MFTFGPGLRGGVATRGSGTLPTARGPGTFVSNGDLSNNLTVSWPAASAVGDLGLLFGFTSVSRAIATPSGWTLLRNFSVSDGSGGGVQAYVFWKYNAGDTAQNISIGGSSGFVLGSLYGVRNAFNDPTNGPFDAIDVITGTVSASTASFPNIVPVESNSQVFLCAIRATTGSPWFTISSVGNLGSFSEQIDSSFSSGARQGGMSYGVASLTGSGAIGTVSANVTAGIVSTLAFNVFG